MKLLKKILSIVLVPLLIGIILCLVTYNTVIIGYAPEWMKDSSDNMIQIQKDSLDQLALQNTNYFSEILGQVASDMNILHEFTEQVLNNQINASSLTSYCGVLSWGGATPGPLVFDQSLGYSVNNISSFWFIPDVGNLIAGQIVAGDLIPLTSLLDIMFITLSKSNSAFVGLYYGEETLGFFRNYPFTNANSFLTKQIECPREGIYTETHVGFDPRCREWYSEAILTDNIIYTAPYLDFTSGKLLITAAHRVMNISSGALLGVVAVDLSIDQLENHLLSTRIKDNGYGYVIDNQGKVVIHPSLDRNVPTPTINSLEFYGFDMDYNPQKEVQDFSSILTSMTSMIAGSASFTKTTVSWLISYRGLPQYQYSLAVLVPFSDILKPAIKVEDSIYFQINTNITVIIILVVLITISLIISIVLFAQRIVLPINELKVLTDHITKGDLDDTVVLHDMCVEMSLLTSSFHTLLTALRFADSAYHGQDMEKAKLCYLQALDLFVKMNNEKGIGLCHNNLAMVYLSLSQFENSLQHINQAIKEIEGKLIQFGQSSENIYNMNHVDNANFRPLYVTLSNRMNNKALILLEMKEYNQSESLLVICLDIDRRYLNLVGYVTHSGNLAKVYENTNRISECIRAYTQTYTLLSDPEYQNQLEHSDYEISMSYSNYHMGLACRLQNMNDQAIPYFIQSLRFKYLDSNVKIKVLNELLALFSDRNDVKSSQFIRNELKHSVKLSMASKDIMLVLDHSGSMAGGRIKISLQNIRTLLENYIYDEDFVGLITFDDQAQIIFELSEKKSHYQTQISLINNLSPPAGRTALYDSLGLATDHLVKSPHKDQRWLVCLTDGDDTSSKYFTDERLYDKLRASDITGIIIIPVGREVQNLPYLQSLTVLKGQGALINCKKLDDLDEAFIKIGQMISGQAMIESM